MCVQTQGQCMRTDMFHSQGDSRLKNLCKRLAKRNQSRKTLCKTLATRYTEYAEHTEHKHTRPPSSHSSPILCRVLGVKFDRRTKCYSYSRHWNNMGQQSFKWGAYLSGRAGVGAPLLKRSWAGRVL